MNLIETAEKLGVTGFLHPVELEKLAELATNRDVLEIGSYRGLSAWGMAITAKSLTCVDTFRAWTNGQDQHDYLTTFEPFRDATRRFSNVEVFVGKSHEVNIQREWDMIFLDALHAYDSVLDDIRRWWPRVRPGGILAGHDYGHSDFPGVKQAFDEVFGPAPEGTVLVTLRWVTKEK